MTALVMIVCLLMPDGAGCVQITEPAASEAACRDRAEAIRRNLDAAPNTKLIGALVRCDGPAL